MRIAWFSPISNKSLTRAAFFSSQVLPILPDDWDIEIFVDDAEYRNLLTSDELDKNRFLIFHFLRAFARHAEKPFDCFVYQLEDHPSLTYIYDSLSKWPGLVLVHDLNFNRLELARLSYATSPTLLNQKMDYRFGPGAVRLGDLQVRDWSTDVFDSLYPMFDLSKFDHSEVVFTSSWMRTQANQFFCEAKGLLLNFPIQVVAGDKIQESRRRVREKFQIGPDEKIILFSGQNILRNRVNSILEASEEVKLEMNKQGIEFRLIWVIEDDVVYNNAQKILKRNIIDSNIVVIKKIEDSSELLFLVSAADLVLALQFDLLRARPLCLEYALACGITVVVSDTGGMQDIPDNLTFKISVGVDEKKELTQVIKYLLVDDSLRFNIGRAEQDFIRKYNDPANVARDMQGHIKENLIKIAESIHRNNGASVCIRKSLCENLRIDLQGILNINQVEQQFKEFGWR